MKIQWNSDINFQNEAVDAAVNLFKGQNSTEQYFSVFGQLYVGMGIGNKIDISIDDVLCNLNYVQICHKLVQSDSLDSLDFDIIMAKGTGKTYVYLKTIFELNKKYNFTKFIIVVSDEIQANYVKNVLDDTKEHFKNIFDNVVYTYFIYDSHDLEYIRNYVLNSDIEIMIISINSFRSKNSIIYKEQEKLMEYKPIDLIAETNPVVIIDETEKILRGKGKNVITYLNPLFSLRYSSKLVNYCNLIYYFDFLDAYELFRLNYFENK